MLAAIKKMRGTTGFVIGVIAALLIVPSVAEASGITLVHLVGAKSGNQAEVTDARQLLVTQAQPASTVQSPQAVFFSGHASGPIVTAPAKYAIVVSNIAVDAYSVPIPGTDDFVVYLTPAPNSGKCNAPVGTWTHYFILAGIGEVDLPVSPGLVVPAGWSLCGEESGTSVFASVSGQQVPKAEAPAPGSIGDAATGPLSRAIAVKHPVF
jgi:hypothetical protein